MRLLLGGKGVDDAVNGRSGINSFQVPQFADEKEVRVLAEHWPESLLKVWHVLARRRRPIHAVQSAIRETRVR